MYYLRENTTLHPSLLPDSEMQDLEKIKYLLDDNLDQIQAAVLTLSDGNTFDLPKAYGKRAFDRFKELLSMAYIER